VHGAANGHTHLDLRYLLVAPDQDPAPRPGESPLARWFGWQEATSVADAALQGALRAARLQPEVHTAKGCAILEQETRSRSGEVGERRRPRHNGADGKT
jgi:hypothetical protein